VNRKQWSVLAFAAVVFSISALFPPWLYRCENGLFYSAGYRFFAKPPEIKNICQSSDPLPAPPPPVLRNGNRQMVQGLIVIVLTTGLLLILRSPRTNLSVVLAVLIIGIGTVGLLYLGLMIQFEL